MYNSALPEMDEPDMAMGLRNGGLALKPKMVKQPGYMHGGKITMPKQPGYMYGGKVKMPKGYRKGGTIGDVKKDDGTDKVDVKAREGEYFLNPETVAHIGGGDYKQGVRNLNAVVRQATGKEPGPVPVNGKKGFVLSGANIPDSQLRPEFRAGGMNGFGVDDVNRMTERAYQQRVAAAQAAQAAPQNTYEQGVRARADQMRQAAQQRVAAAAAAPAAPTASTAPAAAATPAAGAAPAAPVSTLRALSRATAPALLGAGAAYVNKAINETQAASQPAATPAEIPAAGPGQIPVDPNLKAPPKVAERSPLGIGPNNEFTRNVANAINAIPAGAPITRAMGVPGAVSLFRQGSNAARAQDAVGSAINVVRGAQLANETALATPTGNAAAASTTPQTGMSEVQAFGLNTPGGVRDLTSILNTVPRDLPPDMRENVIYKTIDANGRPVYSGRNVGPDAGFVNGKGESIDSRGSLSVVPGMATGGGQEGGAASSLRASPSMATQQALSSALSAAAARGDFDAIRNFYEPGSVRGGIVGIGGSSNSRVMDTINELKKNGVKISNQTLRTILSESGGTQRQEMANETSRANTESNNATTRATNQLSNRTSRENNQESNATLRRGQDLDFARSLLSAGLKKTDDGVKAFRQQAEASFQRPVLDKDGKPTGKTEFDEAAYNRFEQSVTARLAEQGVDPFSLTAAQRQSLLREYQVKRGVTDNIQRSLSGLRDAPVTNDLIQPKQISPGPEVGLRTWMDPRSSVRFGNVWDSMWKGGDFDKTVNVDYGNGRVFNVPQTELPRQPGTTDIDVIDTYKLDKKQ